MRRFYVVACRVDHDLNRNDMLLNIRSVYYHYHIYRFSKSDAVNLLQNADLTEKRGIL